MSNFPRTKLVNKLTREPVKVGDKVTSFRGEVCTVVDFEPPNEPHKSGYVRTDAGRYYAGVYDLEFIA